MGDWQPCLQLKPKSVCGFSNTPLSGDVTAALLAAIARNPNSRDNLRLIASYYPLAVEGTTACTQTAIAKVVAGWIDSIGNTSSLDIFERFRILALQLVCALKNNRCGCNCCGATLDIGSASSALITAYARNPSVYPVFYADFYAYASKRALECHFRYPAIFEAPRAFNDSTAGFTLEGTGVDLAVNLSAQDQAGIAVVITPTTYNGVNGDTDYTFDTSQTLPIYLYLGVGVCAPFQEFMKLTLQ